jgi:hypothetical protein
MGAEAVEAAATEAASEGTAATRTAATGAAGTEAAAHRIVTWKNPPIIVQSFIFFLHINLPFFNMESQFVIHKKLSI